LRFDKEERRLDRNAAGDSSTPDVVHKLLDAVTRQPLFVGIATPVCLTRKVAVANLSVEGFVERDVAPKLLREPHTARNPKSGRSLVQQNNTKKPP